MKAQFVISFINPDIEDVEDITKAEADKIIEALENLIDRAGFGMGDVMHISEARKHGYLKNPKKRRRRK